MKYWAVLGRQPKISLAELESLFAEVRLIAPNLAEFQVDAKPELKRLGGSIKLAEPITGPVLDYLLESLPKDHKITLGVSDFSKNATAPRAQHEALRLKCTLRKSGYSVRVVPNKTALISSAASYHNRLGEDDWRVELLRHGKAYARVIAVQDIEAYVERDQARPARDARVGMLPPKLAQILINLCGPLPAKTILLDPFCGSGVVLQEASLMGYTPYGTDLSDRMVEYTERNLKWLGEKNATVEQGDATNHQWNQPIGAVACETYLGPPMSAVPIEVKLKEAKQECGGIILGFLKNLATQIEPETPVVIAVPAWLRTNGEYQRLNILDEIQNLGYNVKSFRNLGPDDLLYHRDQQIVAREIIVLRKK